MMHQYTTRNFISTLTGSFFCLSCHALYSKPEKPKFKKLKARITYYTADKKYGIKVADPKTKFAVEGVTIAAHSKFKFGSKVSIPFLKGKIGDGNYIVQDRGSAVNSKKAARGNGYVFDVYVSSHKTLKHLAETMPMWMDVYIYS